VSKNKIFFFLNDVQDASQNGGQIGEKDDSSKL